VARSWFFMPETARRRAGTAARIPWPSRLALTLTGPSLYRAVSLGNRGITALRPRRARGRAPTPLVAGCAVGPSRARRRSERTMRWYVDINSIGSSAPNPPLLRRRRGVAEGADVRARKARRRRSVRQLLDRAPRRRGTAPSIRARAPGTWSAARQTTQSSRASRCSSPTARPPARRCPSRARLGPERRPEGACAASLPRSRTIPPRPRRRRPKRARRGRRPRHLRRRSPAPAPPAPASEPASEAAAAQPPAAGFDARRPTRACDPRSPSSSPRARGVHRADGEDRDPEHAAARAEPSRRWSRRGPCRPRQPSSG
jgi:hypothetical protein